MSDYRTQFDGELKAARENVSATLRVLVAVYRKMTAAALDNAAYNTAEAYLQSAKRFDHLAVSVSMGMTP
jgi:hypothetical protein